MERRLFVVSDKLPVEVNETNGIKPASTGLFHAINSYVLGNPSLQFSHVSWCGIPDCNIGTWISASKVGISTPFNTLPVFVPENEHNGYCNGHSNAVIWPLFHYFPSYAEYSVDHYEQYLKVNNRFAEALQKKVRPGDTIWIHDYHLLPLAALLRREMPEAQIGLFLHTPFPSFELFRLLPKKWQEETLKGMLGADLIGFQTIDYAAHFLQSVLMILAVDNERNIINFDNRLIKVDVFPVSIDYAHFQNGYNNVQVRWMRDALRKRLAGRKMIFTSGKLDYTSGLLYRLKAYEHFLAKNPQYSQQVVLYLVIEPSALKIARYSERKKELEATIERINLQGAGKNWQPVVFKYEQPTAEEMLCYYTACDVALTTPLRDGMNLAGKEFVASRTDKKGVLIISEMAGAARELTDALTVNPNDMLEMAHKIKLALEMPADRQALYLEVMQKRIANYDLLAWGNDFMNQLVNIKQKQETFKIRFLDEYSKRNLYDKFRYARKRLFLLDYDGSIVSFAPAPESAVPHAELLHLIGELSTKKENDMYLISGRNSGWLQQYFGHLPINLVAEHGARYKMANEQWVTNIQTPTEWKEQVHNLMEIYVRRCANSFVEEKDFSMVWHYRNANFEQGKLRAYELMSELNEYVRQRHLQVVMGNRVVEVRHSGINKAGLIRKIIERSEYDFIFAVGDDRSDEDMFRALINYKNTFTIKVGSEASFAQYNLHTPQMVVTLLEGMNYLNSPALL